MRVHGSIGEIEASLVKVIMLLEMTGVLVQLFLMPTAGFEALENFDLAIIGPTTGLIGRQLAKHIYCHASVMAKVCIDWIKFANSRECRTQ